METRPKCWCEKSCSYDRREKSGFVTAYRANLAVSPNRQGLQATDKKSIQDISRCMSTSLLKWGSVMNFRKVKSSGDLMPEIQSLSTVQEATGGAGS